jgi:hypothetical protein
VPTGIRGPGPDRDDDDDAERRAREDVWEGRIEDTECGLRRRGGTEWTNVMHLEGQLALG